ncbi:hypothetical protein [Rubrolithibacter danxiaensis]|uniref:hypothetical protein n=1 Tax=Rubrolithibacter danxiaensis TaxID=3390805 RepID=UPI003BF86708
MLGKFEKHKTSVNEEERLQQELEERLQQIQDLEERLSSTNLEYLRLKNQQNNYNYRQGRSLKSHNSNVKLTVNVFLALIVFIAVYYIVDLLLKFL